MRHADARTFSLLLLVLAIPAVLPVHAQFRSSWTCLSIDYGTPIRGMVKDPANHSKFDYTGKGTSWNDGSANLTFGWVPFMVSSTMGLGFSVRGSAAISLGNNGEVAAYGTIPVLNIRVYEGKHSYFYLGSWAAVSPMVAARILVRPSAYINIGAGTTFWKYLGMEYKGREDNDNLLDDAVYDSFAAMAQLSIEWFYVEAGLGGPDFYFGLGFSL